jgi:hypothetical protein
MQISTQAQLQALARELGVRPDWHEPDEQEVTARVWGQNFDNAGFWGSGRDWDMPADCIEMWVTLYRDGEPVAEVNLATLFAFACGTDG